MATEEAGAKTVERSGAEGDGHAEDLVRHGVPREEVESGPVVSEAQAREMATAQLAEARRLEDEQIAQLPEADQREIRAAQRELDPIGVECHVVTKWWGYEIHLNAKGAQLAAEITEFIGKIVAKFPKVRPFAPLIKLFCKVKAAWIKSVGQSYGCKLVSPWIAPGMLIPIRLGPKEDRNLWWTVFEPSPGWNEDQKFAGHESAANPALAVFNDRLICVHRGGVHNTLWYTYYDPNIEGGWSEDTEISHHASSDGPALAVFNGKLHCVYKDSKNHAMWHMTFDGSRWSGGTVLPHHQTARGPALAAFNNKLHLVHRGGTDDYLWHATYDGSTWSRDTRVGGHKSASNPALAVFNNKLHLVHRGGSDTGLWHSTYSGSGWSGGQSMRAQSLEGPALAVFKGDLYCIHRGYGSGDQNLWWSKYRTSWDTDRKFPGHLSGAGPAAIVYKDTKNIGEEPAPDQLLVVHRGAGTKAAGADTAEVEARIAAEQLTAEPDNQ